MVYFNDLKLYFNKPDVKFNKTYLKSGKKKNKKTLLSSLKSFLPVRKKKCLIFGSAIFSLIFVLNWENYSWSGMEYFTLQRRFCSANTC